MRNRESPVKSIAFYEALIRMVILSDAKLESNISCRFVKE